MKSIILIAGLPGSGKARLADEISQTEANCTVLADRNAIASHGQETSANETLVVHSPDFCSDTVRDETTKLLQEKFGSQCPIRWIFFENKSCICMENVGHRRKHTDNRQIAKEILALSKHYHIPEDAPVEKVIIEKVRHRPA